METAQRKKIRAEMVLAAIIVCQLVALGALIIYCLPYINPSEDPQAEIAQHHQTEQTQIPTTLPPETLDATAPTEAQPETWSYGRLDFQFDGRYLSCLKTDTIPGVDVSAYQGVIDWQQVADSGIQFAMVRLGYRGYGTGKLVEDSYAMRNIAGALAAGLDVGVYFFSQAITVEEAQEEAAFILERIQNYDITMPIVFNWEFVNDEARTAGMDRRTLTDCYAAFCEAIAQAGYTPMSYFNWYQSEYDIYLTELEDYPFWLALYTCRMTFPYAVEMWQYTCTGSVPGISGDVDIDIYFPNG